jgi:uncharacterized Ntn-hydrolase superfamily protein
MPRRSPWPCTVSLARVTYSIIARDDEALGVAVQSEAFNAGAAVPWVQAGVGAVATQSFTDRRYGYRGLGLLAASRSPKDALDELLAADALPGFRQVAFMSVSGETAQWTGGDCIRHAGHASGERWAAQGNMLAAEAWHAMGSAFASTTGSLGQRLMAALEAAEDAGGDFRGRGGCAIVVAPVEGDPWERILDLRVEEGDDSLVQLRRLLERAEGYRAAGRAVPGAPVARERGLPEAFVLRIALTDAVAAGDEAEARRLLGELERLHPQWLDALRAMTRHPDSPPGLRAIVGD